MKRVKQVVDERRHSQAPQSLLKCHHLSGSSSGERDQAHGCRPAPFWDQEGTGGQERPVELGMGLGSSLSVGKDQEEPQRAGPAWGWASHQLFLEEIAEGAGVAEAEGPAAAAVHIVPPLKEKVAKAGPNEWEAWEHSGVSMRHSSAGPSRAGMGEVARAWCGPGAEVTCHGGLTTGQLTEQRGHPGPPGFFRPEGFEAGWSVRWGEGRLGNHFSSLVFSSRNLSNFCNIRTRLSRMGRGLAKVTA